MRLLTTKKLWCGCIENETTHFVYEDSEKKIWKICPLCGKMTRIDLLVETLKRWCDEDAND